MKRGYIFAFVFILLISFVYAEPVLKLNKQAFQPGETLLAEISTTGQFQEKITLNNIEFFEARKKVYFDSDIIFYNNTYYFYAYLNKQGNFTLNIKNILYKEDALKSISLTSNLEVKENYLDENKTTQILSVKPGFVSSLEKKEISLTNKGNSILNITILNSSLELNPEEFTKFSFIPEKGFYYLQVLSYGEFNIPIIPSFLELNTTQNQTQEQETILKSNPELLQIKAIANNRTYSSLDLVNFAEQNITIKSINSELSILEFNNIDQIPAKEIATLTFEIYSENQGFFKSNLTIIFLQNSTEKELIIPLEIYVFPENSNIYDEDLQSTIKTCEEINGQICNQNQKCDSEETYAGGLCCLGNCNEIKQPGNYNWIIGVVIFIVVLGAGYFAYKKFKKTTPAKPEEKLKQSSKLYEKKISGSLTRN